MALLFGDSFDHGGLSRKWASVGNNAIISTGNGRNGTNGFRHNAITGQTTTGLKATLNSLSTVIVGHSLRMLALPSSEVFLSGLREGGIWQVFFTMASDGKLRAYRGTGTGFSNLSGTLLGTASGALSAVAAHYLEFKTTIHSSAGAIEIRQNGSSTPILSLTGANTKNTNAAGSTATILVAFGFPAENVTSGFNSSWSEDYYVDDFYLCDTSGTKNNDFLGDVRVQAIFPTAAGNYAQWTPNAGSNWDRVDDATPDDDTTYNSSSTAGQKDSFTYGNLTPTSGVVHGVLVNPHTRKDDAGSRNIRALARLSGVDAVGPSVGITTNYVNYQQVFEQKPGGGDWTIADVNNAEFGYELVS